MQGCHKLSILETNCNICEAQQSEISCALGFKDIRSKSDSSGGSYEPLLPLGGLSSQGLPWQEWHSNLCIVLPLLEMLSPPLSASPMPACPPF